MEYLKIDLSENTKEDQSPSLASSRYQDNLPKLSDLTNMHISKVEKWLTKIPHGIYYGMSRKELVNEITYNEAFRYLTELIMLNEQFKSNLDYVSEVGSSEEYSNYI